MPSRIAYVLQVIVLAASSNTALRTSRPVIVTDLITEKSILKLNHTGIGKKQRWIIAGHERATGNNLVSPAGKKV